MIDRIVDLVNSKNLRSSGFKKPLQLKDEAKWMKTLDEVISYFEKLKVMSGQPLLQHRRKNICAGIYYCTIQFKGPGNLPTVLPTPTSLIIFLHTSFLSII